MTKDIVVCLWGVITIPIRGIIWAVQDIIDYRHNV
jgi:hypothetical protein